MSDKFEIANESRNAALSVEVDGTDYLADLTAATVAYCSLSPETDEERKQLYNAVNNPAHRLSEMIGKVISVKHIYCEVVPLVNEKTGDVTKAPRIVFFGDDGESYTCVSVGIFGAVKKVFAIYGTPDTWDKPLRFEVRQIEKGSGKRLLSLNIV